MTERCLLSSGCDLQKCKIKWVALNIFWEILFPEKYLRARSCFIEIVYF